MADPRRLAPMVCALLAACNDTRGLAPAGPSTPWQTSVASAPSASAPLATAPSASAPSAIAPPAIAPAPAGIPARRYALPSDPALPWPGEPADIDPSHRYSLPELIDMAQRRNSQTRIAWEQAVQAAIGVGITRAAFLPEVTASALGGYQHIASPFPTNLVRKGYITANAQEVLPELAIKYLLIDFGGGREASEQGAEQLSFAANVAFTGVHQRLILQVARAYFTLDGVDAQLEAVRKGLDDARRLQQSAEALQGRGLATVVSTQLARRNTAQATYELAQATATQHDAVFALLQALELPPNTRLLIQDSFDRPLPRATAGNVDRLMQDALHQRADLLAGLARLRAADAGVAEARGAMSPKLLIDSNVQGNIGRISVDSGRYESVTQPQTGLFLRFEWPLYQGGLRQNQVRLAESRRNEAQDALEASNTSVLREVAVAYDQVQTGIIQYEAAIELRLAAQTAFDSASDAFAHGVGSFTDAVNASTALDSARAAVARAHAQALVNAAGLAFATGALASSADLSP